MYYSDLRKYDSQNGFGLGIGVTLFVSGCNFHCKGCFNKEAWDFNYGKPFTKDIEDLVIFYSKNKRIHHVSLLGGEIFHQDLNIILSLVKRIKTEVNKPIYVWTGFTWEELIKDNQRKDILQYIDIITDGQFIQEQKNVNLLYAGSNNQRHILVQESLNQNEIIIKNN